MAEVQHRPGSRFARLPLAAALFSLPLLMASCEGGANAGSNAATDAAGAGDRASRAARVAGLSEAEIEARAREIHARVITIDTHVDIPNNFASDDVDPGIRGRFQNDLPKMREGGLDAAFFIVYQGQGERTPEGYAAANRIAMGKFEGIRRMTSELYPDQIGLAYTADDVERLHAEGKLVALIGVENAFGLGTDLSTWQRYYDLGARYVSLTHNGHNDFGDAAVEVARLGDDGPEWGGLSPLGLEAIEVLNRLGIMVDISHAGRETMLQKVAASRAPVIASHSSIRAVADHPRNLDDEQLRALAARGGVAQTTALGAFVKVQPEERAEAVAALRQRFGIEGNADIQRLEGEARAEWEAGLAEIEARFPSATLADYIDHIDYAVDLVGIDHVGISSDFDGGGGVTGWMDTSETLNVTIELVRRGYNEDEIRKLWGGNLLRVMREVEAVAATLQSNPESEEDAS
jgi:membrane dipeptidase